MPTDAIDQIKDETTKQFSIACYDMNTIEELSAPDNPQDEQSRKDWGLTLEQYREAIAAALDDLISDLEAGKEP